MALLSIMGQEDEDTIRTLVDEPAFIESLNWFLNNEMGKIDKLLYKVNIVRGCH